MELTQFIKVYDNVVSKPICDQLINLFDNKYGSNHEIHDTDLYKFHQLNLGINEELRKISEQYILALVPSFNNYFESLGLKEFVNIESFEEVRIKRYLKNTSDQFKTHVDVVNKETCMRYLVAILYLNDNDGVTDFPKLNISVKPKTGRVVMFPPLWLFPHSGKNPTDNDKYIMMTSLHYK